MRDLTPIIEALAASTDDSATAILLEHKVTPAEFRELDDHPGRWGYMINGREWHYKIRRFRNTLQERIVLACLTCGHRFQRTEGVLNKCPICGGSA